MDCALLEQVCHLKYTVAMKAFLRFDTLFD
jgi:hypothetical protein